jgi:hypothetical protein
MRKTLVLAVALVASALGACSTNTGGGCGACGAYGTGNDCAPKTLCCPTWQPNCCNNWDFYVPCDMIEGREYRQGTNCAQVPTCAPCK